MKAIEKALMDAEVALITIKQMAEGDSYKELLGDIASHAESALGEIQPASEPLWAAAEQVREFMANETVVDLPRQMERLADRIEKGPE